MTREYEREVEINLNDYESVRVATGNVQLNVNA